MALLEMIQNLALIISLAMIYRVIMFRVKRNTAVIQVLIGLMFGVFTVVGMQTPFHMTPGVIYDGRSIILSLAGLFSGPLPTLVAAAVAAAYRISLGGAGVIAGVSTVAVSSLLGNTFFYLRRAGKLEATPLTIAGLGFIVHVGMLLCQLMLPNRLGFEVWREIGLYVLLFFTSASLIIGLLFLDSETQLHNRRQLLKNEKTLRKAQQIAHIGNWSWQNKDHNLDGSDEFFAILGLEKDGFAGQLGTELIKQIHPDDLETVNAAWKELLSVGSPKSFEFRIIHADSSTRILWAEAGETVLDNRGQITSVSGIVQDITERRAAEIKLKENESRYRSLIMNSPDAILVNHHDQYVLANRAAVELFGARDASDLIGKTPWELFHPGCHKLIEERIHNLRETDSSTSLVQEQIIRMDGQVVDVDVVTAPIFLEGTKDIHVILRDITARKRMEDELRASHDLLARLADQVPGAVFQFCMHPDGRKYFPFTSPSVAKNFNLSPEEARLTAFQVMKRIHPDDRKRAARFLLESARTLEVYNCEFRILISESNYRWYQCNAQPERLPDDGTLWSGILSDVTDRKLDEQKIAEQLNELRRWQSVMLGREKRTIELKHEVNALLRELGRPINYPIEDETVSYSQKPMENAVHARSNHREGWVE